MPNPISWADEERDLTAWLGNEMQHGAFKKLYSLGRECLYAEDPSIQQDFGYLQVSDHFYYMSTKFFSDGEVHSYFNPYDTPYDAFINYMNVLSDFEIRVNAAQQSNMDKDLAGLTRSSQKRGADRKYEELKSLNPSKIDIANQVKLQQNKKW